MTNKHTPGPWTIGADYHDDGNNRIDIRASHNEFGDTKMLAMVRTTNTKTAKADAKLIVAAPDLLEALEFVLKEEKGLGVGTKAFIKKAIKKATE